MDGGWMVENKMKNIINTIYNIIRDGWESINLEQKLSMAGIIIGMAMVIYAFQTRYGLYIGVSGYVLTLFCSICYGLFKYFPILKKSKQRIPQKTFNDYIR